jgi:hypothetical protein
MISLLALIGLVTLFVIAIVLTETEKFGWATVLLVGTVALGQFFHVVDVLTWVRTHSTETILYALAYVGVGVVWSFIKWYSYLLNFRDKFRAHKEAFLVKRGLDPKTTSNIPTGMMEDFESYIRSAASWSDRHLFNTLTRPRAAENKSRIVSWMSLWPCSVIGTVLNDPVRRLFNFLFQHFKALYQKLADHVFRQDSELK